MTAQDFNNTVEKMRPKLIGFANTFVKTGAYTSEDLVQDAVLKLWKSIDKYEIKNSEAFTIQILKHLCLDYLKSKKNNNEPLNNLAKNLSDISPHEKLEKREMHLLIHNQINKLPAEQQISVRLRDIMGYEMSEIAEIMQIKEGNVRTLLSRARKKIRERIL